MNVVMGSRHERCLGLNNGQSDRNRNYAIWYRFFLWIVGAVFNRDYPFNSGWKPLPPTINYNLNDIELNEVSYEK